MPQPVQSQIPSLNFNANQALKDGYSEDEVLNHLATKKGFNAEKALADGYTKRQLIDHLSGFQTNLGKPDTTNNLINKAVDVARFVLPPLGGAAASVGAAPSAPFTFGAGPAAAGIAGYTALDTLLKRLKTGDKPSLGEDLGNSALEGTLNEVGGRLIGKAYKTGKAFVNAGIPDSGSILKLAPTASQALNSIGDHPIYGAITKFLEDNFALGSKKAAQENSMKLGIAGGEKLAAKEAGRSVSTVTNPNTMVKLISGELVPEETQAVGKIVPRTADYQPIKIVPQNEFIDRATGSTPITQTRVTGPVQQVEIPGAYEILPGVIKKTPYATDPASLDALIKNPDRLQNALTKSQAEGLGINSRQDLAGYKLARIQQAASSTAADGTTQVSPQQVLDALKDKDMTDSYKILFKGSNGLSNMQQFYKNLALTQDKPGTSHIVRYMNTFGLAFPLVHSAISGSFTGALEDTAKIAALELSAAGLAKLLTTPQAGRLMISLANKETLGVSQQYAARMIMKTLKGTTNYLVDDKGNRISVQDKDGGELVPLGK